MSEQRCMYCRGMLERRLVTRAQEHEGRWIVIENLPALVCQQCGERYYTPDAHALVVALVQGHASPIRTEVIAVYDATRVA